MNKFLTIFYSIKSSNLFSFFVRRTFLLRIRNNCHFFRLLLLFCTFSLPLSFSLENCITLLKLFFVERRMSVLQHLLIGKNQRRRQSVFWLCSGFGPPSHAARKRTGSNRIVPTNTSGNTFKHSSLHGSCANLFLKRSPLSLFLLGFCPKKRL